MKETMKKSKYYLLLLLIVPCMLLFTACSNSKVSVVSITKIDETETTETYSILYSDGSTNNFEMDKDEKSDNGMDIYELAIKYGYEGTFWDFMEDYLSFDSGSDVTTAVSKALPSSVSVVSDFVATVIGYRPTIYGLEAYTYEQEYQSAGSGVIYSLDKDNGNAYIITNYHVVYDVNSNDDDKISDNITIYLYGMENEESAINVDYVGGSMMYDIAVLKVENSDILKNSIATSVTVADSDDVIVGQTAIAVGNPEALGISATSGVVSVDSEYITMTASDDETPVTFRVMRIDTAINGGNSGGGLFNDDGELIGIVNAKVVKSDIDNISYAIPSAIATAVADNIIDNGSVKLFDLGASVSGTNSKAIYDGELLAVRISEDVSVTSVEAGSIASKMGLSSGDIIKSIRIDEAVNVDRAYEFVDELLDIRSGDTIAITILRDGEEVIKGYSVTDDDFIQVA